MTAKVHIQVHNKGDIQVKSLLLIQNIQTVHIKCILRDIGSGRMCAQKQKFVSSQDGWHERCL